MVPRKKTNKKNSPPLGWFKFFFTQWGGALKEHMQNKFKEAIAQSSFERESKQTKCLVNLLCFRLQKKQGLKTPLKW